MSEKLEKIDILRRRFNISYREAKAALEHADGDVVAALMYLEENAKGPDGDLGDLADGVWGKIRDVWQRASETRLRVKDGERTVFEVPAPMGALGVLGALASSELAVLGAVGAVAAMAKKYTIEVETAGREEPEEPVPGGEGLE